MSLALFFSSLLIGLSVAAPVGAIGVLVIRRTLYDGRMAGLATGLGAAAADALYGAVGAFGLTLLTTWMVNSSDWLRLIGGLFLCGLGIRTLFTAPAAAPPVTTSAAHATAFFTTFALTLTNPLTILSFAAIFAGLGIANTSHDLAAAWTVVVGVFLGSALWWVVLSSGVAWWRHRITPRTLVWINRASGVLVFGFGVAGVIAYLVLRIP